MVSEEFKAISVARRFWADPIGTSDCVAVDVVSNGTVYTSQAGVILWDSSFVNAARKMLSSGVS
jgi:hypothetical protein